MSVSIANAAAAIGAVAVAYGGGPFAEEIVINRGGEIGELHTAETCEAQEATIVKAIHAVCVAASGEEFPASHMLADTWIEASYEGEGPLHRRRDTEGDDWRCAPIRQRHGGDVRTRPDSPMRRARSVAPLQERHAEMHAGSSGA